MAANRGPLKTKLKPRHLPVLVSAEEQLEVIRPWHKEDHDKLLLLCAEMGIDDGPSRFYDLSWHWRKNITLPSKSLPHWESGRMLQAHILSSRLSD